MNELEEIRRNLVSLQSTVIYSVNKKRLDDFYKAIETAKEAIDGLIQGWDDEEFDETAYWEASNENDASLISHINRRS